MIKFIRFSPRDNAMNEMDAQDLIAFCRKIAEEGMPHVEKSVTIPPLFIDWVTGKSTAALGRGNVAIFVNEQTYRLNLFTKFSTKRNWIANQTLVIREADHSSFTDIGVVIHETGHAFNVAAGITNNEKNAYIFEIIILYQLFIENKLRDVTKQDFRDYFNNRIEQYKKALPDKTLNNLLHDLAEEFEIDYSLRNLDSLNSPQFFHENSENSHCATILSDESTYKVNLF